MYHNLYHNIHLVIDILVVLLLAIINETTVKACVQVFVWTKASNQLVN